MKKRVSGMLLFTLVVLIAIPMISAQEMVKIKGIAVDNLRNQMPGVSVNYQYQGQQSDTVVTDSNGIYTIEVPLLDDGDNVIYLEFSKENYRSTAHVIYKRDDLIIVEEQDFDECFPQCNPANCQGPMLDAEHKTREFETVEELESNEFNANLYPFSNVYLFWDEPVIMDMTYETKNCRNTLGNTHGGNSNLKEEHVLGYSLPLSYNAEVILTTQGGKETRIPVYNDQFGKAIKIYKKGNEALFEVCESQVCTKPESKLISYIEEDESNLISYILIGVAILILFIVLIVLIIILRNKKKQVQPTNYA